MNAGRVPLFMLWAYANASGVCCSLLCLPGEGWGGGGLYIVNVRNEINQNSRNYNYYLVRQTARYVKIMHVQSDAIPIPETYSFLLISCFTLRPRGIQQSQAEIE